MEARLSGDCSSNRYAIVGTTEAIVGAGAISGAFLLLPRIVNWLQPEVIHAPSPPQIPPTT